MLKSVLLFSEYSKVQISFIQQKIKRSKYYIDYVQIHILFIFHLTLDSYLLLDTQFSHWFNKTMYIVNIKCRTAIQHYRLKHIYTEILK